MLYCDDLYIILMLSIVVILCNKVRYEGILATRILVINDDESILELFQMLLQSEGYEVLTSVEAIENIADVADLTPDLVILDLKLGMQEEGWIMLQKLRMYPPTTGIPVIICTAALDVVRQQESTLQDKNIPIVYKPFSLDELMKAVHSVLSDDKFNDRLSEKKKTSK
jgi:DNA-binding response OmpR family regulator